MSTGNDQGQYNVWIVGSNTVYRGVPFTVVCDWIQEGRLLPRDCVRTPNEQNWHYLSDMPLFQPYFPGQDTTARADDAAEAYAPIEMEFQPKEASDEGEDPDMIPLIDVSMVLLVFFMMTSSALLADSPDVRLPEVQTAYNAEKKGVLYITVRRFGTSGNEFRYRVGTPKAGLTPEEREKWIAGVKEEQLDQALESGIKQVCDAAKIKEVKKVVISADKDTPFDIIQDKLQVPLEKKGLKVEFKVDIRPGSPDAGT
jgi:biopolymer transport protein ExbD